MVVFDTATLLLAFFPTASPPIDPATGQPLTQCEARVNHLIETLNNSGRVILVPTPVLTQLLAGAAPKVDDFMRAFSKGNRFRITPFGAKEAVELAVMLGTWFELGKPRDVNESAAKIRLDRQIAAIGKANGADTIYTDDANLAKFAALHDMRPVFTWDLSLPPPRPPIPPRSAPQQGPDGDLFS